MNLIQEGEYGTKETVEILDLAASIYQGVDRALEDKKIDGADLPVALAIGTALYQQGPEAIDGSQIALKEVGELSDNEQQFLRDRYGDKIDDEAFWDIALGLARTTRGINAIRARKATANA